MGLRLGLLTITLLSAASAAELKQETVDAWDQYIQIVDQNMQDRLNPSRTFLWMDENPDRVNRIRAGEVIVEPMTVHSPRRIASGLIHHWIGAAFIPNARAGDIVAVLRDYARYKDYYRPAVVASMPVRQTETSDQFSIVMMNNSFLKSAVEVDSESFYYELDARRWYSVSRSTRVQSIENYGKPDERKLPLATGPGYIWRIHSVTRLVERDGGVYVEVEALALSRDIPMSLRWMVDPIVRREARNSIVTSLRETEAAVGETTNAVTASRMSVGRVSAGSDARSFVKQ